MSDLKYIENKVRKVNELANELVHKANNEINVLKHKITCLTILVALFAVIGACIAFYSIHSMKELFYDMQILHDSVRF